MIHLLFTFIQYTPQASFDYAIKVEFRSAGIITILSSHHCLSFVCIYASNWSLTKRS